MPKRLPPLVPAMAKASTPDETLDALHRAASPLFLIGIWHRRYDTNGPPPETDLYWHRDISDEIRDKLREIRERTASPSVMASLAVREPPPFTFTEALRQLRPKGTERDLFDAMRHFGIRDGLYCTHGSWMVVYGSSRVLKPAPSREQRLSLNAAASLAIDCLKEMTTPKKPKRGSAALSPREVACLRHVANGETTREAADSLGIAPDSVKHFLQRAQKKLKAKSQIHAVAIAIRQRLI